MSTKAYREHRYETFNETCPRVVSKTILFEIVGGCEETGFKNNKAGEL